MNKFMNLKELSKYLGVSYDRAKTIVKMPGFPRILMGTRKYYRAESVDNFFDRKELQCTE